MCLYPDGAFLGSTKRVDDPKGVSYKCISYRDVTEGFDLDNYETSTNVQITAMILLQ